MTSQTEPYCNHDPAAIHDGVCECGHVLRTGVAAADVAALDRIAAVMSGEEWSPDTLDAIAEAVRSTGRHIRDIN